MQKLIRGLHHFRTEIFSSQKELFEHLALGQRPDALFITCCDSRVMPHLITQAGPGELFVLRNIGNIVPPFGSKLCGAAAAIEYAVCQLGVKDIIVCGHSLCGAMRALIDPNQLKDMPTVAQWLIHAEATRAILRENYSHVPSEGLLSVAVQENVLTQLENLKTHPAVAARLASGQLRVQGWVYKMESGEVFIFHPDKGQFLLSCVETQAASPRRSLIGTSIQPFDSVFSTHQAQADILPIAQHVRRHGRHQVAADAGP